MDNDKPKVPGYLLVGKVITYAMYIWVIFGIIMLGVRVFLLAFSANASTPFVQFIYNTSATFLEPFRGIFPPKTVGETGYLDVAALFAMIIYGLIGWGFAALIHFIQNKIDAYSLAAQETARKRLEQSQNQTTYIKKTTISGAPAPVRKQKTVQ